MAEYAGPISQKELDRENMLEFAGWLGLRNNVGVENFAPEDLSVALNVDIDDSLGIVRRKGHSAPVVAGVDRCLWASGSLCLGVGSNSLKLVNPDYSTAILRTGLTPLLPLSYAPLVARAYWSNGVEMGCVENGVNRSWGLPVPDLPTAVATAGALRAGKYQYVVTYLRNDGQESGAGPAGVIELTTVGGIALSAIPVSTDATVTFKVVYATSVGGETLYRVGVITNATTTFSIVEQTSGDSPLITQFLEPPPFGEIVAQGRGVMLVARGNRLYPSEPYSPELFDIRKSIPFPERITMVAPIDRGVFVGTENMVAWLDGDSPEKFDYRQLTNYGAIPGTLFFADGELLGAGDSKERIAFFATKTGLCAGKTGGDLVNLTHHRFSYPIQPYGAGVVRRHCGISQYVVTMQGPETAGNVAA